MNSWTLASLVGIQTPCLSTFDCFAAMLHGKGPMLLLIHGLVPLLGEVGLSKQKRTKCHDEVNKMAYSLVLEVGLHLDVGEQLEQDMTSICYDILGL